MHPIKLVGFAAVTVVAAFISSSAFARTLVWTGATNTQWSILPDDKNWRDLDDPDNTNIAFEEGSDVIFDDTASGFTVALTKTAASGHQFDVGKITFQNESKAYTLTANVDPWVQSYGAFGPMEKKGAGQLTVQKRLDMIGNFTCEGGTFKSTTGSAWVGEFRSTVGSLHDSRTVEFKNGSALTVTGSHMFGYPGSADNVTLLFNGCTVNFGAEQWFPKRMRVVNCPFFRSSGVVRMASGVRFEGSGLSTPYMIGEYWSTATLSIGSRGSYGDIYVEDVTGDGVTVDDKPDLVISNILTETSVTAGSTWNAGTQFRKLGPGCMFLANQSTGSPATSNFEVAEGVLQIGSLGFTDSTRTALGNINPGIKRAITVKSGATFTPSGHIGLPNTPRNWELVLDGGTLAPKDGMGMVFGELTFKNDATYVPQIPFSGWICYGAWGATRKFSVDGTRPYVFQPRSENVGQAFFMVGFTDADIEAREATDVPGHPGFTNLYSVVEFAVPDITKSDAADMTMGFVIRDVKNMTWNTESNYSSTGGWGTDCGWAKFTYHGGIKKTGAGTLVLTAANIYTHTTEVAAGTLVVNGSISKSSGVTVDAGAYLGGLGTVPAVTVAANGGFSVSAAKEPSSALSVPSLTAAGPVCFQMTDANGDKGALDGHTLLKLADKPATLDMTGWKVVGANGRKLSYALAYDPSTGAVSAAFEGGLRVLLK